MGLLPLEQRDGFRIPPSPLGVDAPHWVAKGERVVVAGLSIDAGLFYLGKPVAAKGTTQVLTGSFVDPLLPVAPDGTRASFVLEWPTSFQRMSPPQRRDYVQWLAGGRKDTRVTPIFPLLFMSGLERRVFEDLQGAVPSSEAVELEDELRALAANYGQRSEVLLAKAGELAELIGTLRRSPTLDDLVSSKYSGPAKDIDDRQDTDEGMESSRELALLIAISNAAVAGLQLTADQALIIATIGRWIQHPCASEYFVQFSSIFRERYARLFGQGMRFVALPTTFVHRYSPVEFALQRQPGTVSLTLEAMDVRAATDSPLDLLEDMVEDIQWKLTDHLRSKKHDRHTYVHDEVWSHLMLPREQLQASAAQGMQDIAAEVRSKGIQVLSYPDLLERLGEVPNVDDNQLSTLMLTLKAAGLGLEADWEPRREPRLYDIDTFVAVFVDPLGGVEFLQSEPYQTGQLALQVAAYLKASDDSTEQDTRKYLDSLVPSLPNLTPELRERFHARNQLPFQAATLKELRQRAGRLTPAQTAVVAEVSLRVAAALTLDSKTVLKLLGGINSALRISRTNSQEDLRVALSEAKLAARLIPVRLDEYRVRQLHADSERTLALLLPIFDDEAEAEADTESTRVIASVELQHTAKGLLLDEPHTKFASRALLQAQWPRSKLSVVAADCGLMLDGALEQVNGATLDAWDMCVFDGIDPIEVSKEARDRLAGQHFGEDHSQ